MTVTSTPPRQAGGRIASPAGERGRNEDGDVTARPVPWRTYESGRPASSQARCALSGSRISTVIIE